MKKENLWANLSFVKSSGYRVDILTLLSRNRMSPSMIRDFTGYDIHYISKILKGLRERNLVICLDGEKKKTRFYKITTNGKNVLNKLKKLSFNKIGEGELRFDEDKLFEAVNSTQKIKELTHNFFPYPARFPPSIPRFFIEELTSEGDTVLDPFMGGGTTLVECSVVGRKSYGTDINKLGVFLTKVKTTPIPKETLNKFLSKIKEMKLDAKNVDPNDQTIFSEKDIAFIHPEIRKEIITLKRVIDKFPYKIKSFFLCCLISKCNIFTSRRSKKRKSILNMFFKKCETFIKSLEEYSKKKKTDVFPYFDDAKNILNYLKLNSVDLIITSPSYPDVHTEYNNLMLEGRRGSKLLYNLIDYKEERSPSDYRMKSGKKYFEILDSILEKVLQTLREGGHFVLIIGLKNKNHLRQLKKIFSKNNMHLLNEYVRQIPNRQWYNILPTKKGKGIPFEYIMIYEKKSPEKTEWRELQLEYKKGFVKESIHNIHPYPGSFISKIPNKIIKKHCTKERKELILDNFMGHGTTLVEAIRLGKRSIGIDLNPLAYLLAKLKTTFIDLNLLRKEIDKIINYLSKNIGSRNKSLVLIPDFPNKEEWYHPKVLQELGIINKYIQNIKNRDIKDFLLVAFSNTVVEASGTTYNFITDNMHPKERNYVSVQHIFNKHLNRIFELYYDFYSKLKHIPESKPILGDARKIPLDDGTVDLAITSPPYLNGLDYLKMHRLTYYWFGIPFKTKIKDEIGARSKRGRGDCVIQYKKSMRECMEEVYRVLKRGAYYYMIIGDTYWRNKALQTNKILTDIGKDVGFRFCNEFEMILPGHFYKDHAKEVEWILVFKK